MSVNLMDLVKGAIGKQVLGQLGGILGESEEKTQMGIEAALPAIFGTLMKKASTSSGAQDVFRQVEEQDDSILDNLGDLLGGAGQSGMLTAGLSLAKLLFGNKFDVLGGVLGRKSGLGGNAVSQLLSFLLPVVMSILSRQKKSQGFDALGLANMLGEQKQHLGDSLKGELGDSLGLGDLLSGAGQAANQAGATAGSAASSVGSGARDVADAGGSMIGKLLPVIGLIALALLAWMFLKPRMEADMTPPVAEEVSVELPELPNASDALNIGTLGKNLTGIFTGATETLSGVTDAESASSALPKLQTLQGQLTELAGGFEGVAEADRGPLQKIAGEGLSGFVAIYDKIMAIPGVSDILQPVLEPMMATLKGFAGQ
jgi:hypothetical protein